MLISSCFAKIEYWFRKDMPVKNEVPLLISDMVHMYEMKNAGGRRGSFPFYYKPFMDEEKRIRYFR